MQISKSKVEEGNWGTNSGVVDHNMSDSNCYHMNERFGVDETTLEVELKMLDTVMPLGYG